MNPSKILVSAALVLAALVVGCGGSSSSPGTSAASPATGTSSAQPNYYQAGQAFGIATVQTRSDQGPERSSSRTRTTAA